ncbi:hypothetical protein N180_11190 [Pedobacter antarcticus 4BY]|uniref:Lipocalin-like domain-containing protein n=2 Tax=Pedobacter antarcticus TaxID=34086 RepID=A0A081PLI7_9SPHI|nr:hypothetical protein [Pedobacter antarcticus]KEQ31560.1 hypothetical protein N180_11190 [Pedobacter antarcticus 4BY]SFF25198.1 hypothetical protein SAMN03003324_03008 [Pedobacter antarcticus]
MKRIILALSILTVILAGCKKHDNQGDASSGDGVIGTWQSVAVLNDIGNGKTPWRDLPAKDRTLIYLYANGTAKGLNDYKSYTLEDEGRIIFTKADNSKISLIYTLANNKEMIMTQGACIEACLIRYIKVK